MIIEIPNENSIVKWKNNDKDEWKVAEISDLIKAYEIPQGECKTCRYRNPELGHWVEENIEVGCRRVFCSECGCPPPFEYVSTGDVYSASGYGVINKTKFCPNCGADMRGDKNENNHRNQ